MKRVKNCILVSTVGISLFSNLDRMSKELQVSNKDVGTGGLEGEIYKKIKRYYYAKNWSSLGRALTEIPGDDRLCGAEINSIYALKKKDWLNIWRIVFLVSDTETGKSTGKVLTAYFKECKKIIGLQNVEYRSIKDLQDARPGDFCTFGLRNLVREVGKIFKEAGGPLSLIIDATGGYKAQIAVAVLIGVALNIDVYYRHEKFGDIISFPPLPVSLDYDLLGKHGRLLHIFSEGTILPESEIGPVDEELKIFLEQVKIDGEVHWALSPIGEIFITGFRLRNPRPIDLPDAMPEEREHPVFPDHHYPDGFKSYVKKVWREFPWIKRCMVEDYSGQARMRESGFELREEPGKGGQSSFVISGVYVDHNCFAGKFMVLTTCNRLADFVWAVDQLNQKFAGKQ